MTSMILNTENGEVIESIDNVIAFHEGAGYGFGSVEYLKDGDTAFMLLEGGESFVSCH